MSRKPCKYHCDFGDGQHCYHEGDCVMNSGKPPIGCRPYYVNISERICELCESIKRYSTERGKHNQIKLWATEILCLNEMDRSLDRTAREKTWVEEKDGMMQEVE